MRKMAWRDEEKAARLSRAPGVGRLFKWRTNEDSQLEGLTVFPPQDVEQIGAEIKNFRWCLKGSEFCMEKHTMRPETNSNDFGVFGIN